MNPLTTFRPLSYLTDNRHYSRLRREYVSHREFSDEDLSFKAAAREVDFANPFSVKIKNLIISLLRDF